MSFSLILGVALAFVGVLAITFERTALAILLSTAGGALMLGTIASGPQGEVSAVTVAAYWALLAGASWFRPAFEEKLASVHARRRRRA